MRPLNRKVAKVRSRSKALACLAALAAFATACSEPAASPQPAPAETATARASEADMRAAALLSLSNNSALDVQADPYDLAVTCVVALDSLAARVESGTALNADQKRALASARRVYEQRARDASGGTSEQLRLDVEERKAASGETRQRLLEAVSCIRQIA
jgi:hypothetical protein